MKCVICKYEKQPQEKLLLHWKKMEQQSLLEKYLLVSVKPVGRAT